MQLKSVETTPNPNSMKLNLDGAFSATATYTTANKSDCPDFVERLLAIAGIKSVFVCNDFLTLNRDPRADWRPILEQATELLGGDIARKAIAGQDFSGQGINGQNIDGQDFSSQGINGQNIAGQDFSDQKIAGHNALGADKLAEDTILAQRQAAQKEGQVQIFVQTFRGIPIQVKAVALLTETRISLGDRFNAAAQLAQAESGADYLKERYWADHGVRYGPLEEVANEVADELRGTFDQTRLLQAKDQAPSIETLEIWLKDDDWHRRLAAVQILSTVDQPVSLLAFALKDSNPQVRRLAAAALGTTNSADAVAPLSEALLNDQSIGVRRTAGDALSDLGDTAAQPAVCRALGDPNKLIRWRAARFLSDLGTEEALPFLEAAADDPEFEVRLEIEAAIQRIAGGAQGLGPAWKRIMGQT